MEKQDLQAGETKWQNSSSTDTKTSIKGDGFKPW